MYCTLTRLAKMAEERPESIDDVLFPSIICYSAQLLSMGSSSSVGREIKNQCRLCAFGTKSAIVFVYRLRAHGLPLPSGMYCVLLPNIVPCGENSISNANRASPKLLFRLPDAYNIIPTSHSLQSPPCPALRPHPLFRLGKLK
jgi:hypothetical protein